MEKKLYVGNLPYSATEADISDKLSEFGTVLSCQLITDRDTGRSKGFSFVEMSSEEEAQAAIEALDGVDYDGRPMKVNEAKPRERRSGGDGGSWNRSSGDRDHRGGGGGGDRGRRDSRQRGPRDFRPRSDNK